MPGGYKTGETAGDSLCIHQFADGKKKHAAFLGGIKNDCKYVESSEQSNAPAEPTEQAC